MEPVHLFAPQRWILVFCRATQNRWARWLAFGRYKHVRAYCYVSTMRAWLFYDVTMAGTLIHLAPDGQQAVDYISEFTRDADLVAIELRAGGGRLGSPMTCVSAVKHLIGLRSGALRPDAFYRDCLAAGGKPFGQQLPAAACVRAAGA